MPHLETNFSVINGVIINTLSRTHVINFTLRLTLVHVSTILKVTQKRGIIVLTCKQPENMYKKNNGL